ncbi:MAG: Na+/H+ antiporter subunit E [Halofilum sp. (in: g-proteobacteria)]|nr:Na+/H+ antiporter subunit E [Halofilum sp. (in: g-proteobacteria)]
MNKIAIPALGLFLLWLLLSGHYTVLVTSLGVASCLGVTVLANRLGVLEPDGRSFAFLSRLALYVPWLAKEIVVSNIEVTRLIWHPRLPIRPQVIRTPSSQRTALGLASFANSITLTPGTLSLDADEPGVVVVHAIGDVTAEGLQTGEMDRRVTALEGER